MDEIDADAEGEEVENEDNNEEDNDDEDVECDVEAENENEADTDSGDEQRREHGPRSLENLRCGHEVAKEGGSSGSDENDVKGGSG